jgi:hypothetical protein
MTGSDRRYSEEQVALILRRAAQLDAGLDGSDIGDGLTLDEIERIARDVGLAPDLVARAAAQIDAREPGAAERIFGGPVHFDAEYETRGELPRERYGDVVAAIRRVLGQSGKTSEVLDGLEWKSVGETTQVSVTVRPAGGHTKVQVLADRGGSAMIAYVFPGMGALIGGAIAGAIIDPASAVQGIAIMGTAAGAGFIAARTIWASATRRFRGKFATLVEGVTAQVERGVTEPGEQSPA